MRYLRNITLAQANALDAQRFAAYRARQLAERGTLTLDTLNGQPATLTTSYLPPLVSEDGTEVALPVDDESARYIDTRGAVDVSRLSAKLREAVEKPSTRKELIRTDEERTNGR